MKHEKPLSTGPQDTFAPYRTLTLLMKTFVIKALTIALILQHNLL